MRSCTTLHIFFVQFLVVLCVCFCCGSVLAQANDAIYISRSVPTTMKQGETQEVWIILENTGTTTWRQSGGYALGSQNPQDNLTWGLSRIGFSSVQTILPGQRKRFTFNITAPTTPGFYNFQWRMVQDGVEWFGESSPNIQILVEHNDSQFISQSVPSVMRIGQSYSVTVTCKNTGTTTWTRGTLHKLGSQNPQDNLTWGLGRVLLGTADLIAPGQQKAFTFSVTPPNTPGFYNFQWRMVQDGGGGWFGGFSPNVQILVEHNDAAFVSQSVPTVMGTGETRQVSVTYRNTGSRTWTRAKEHSLGSQNPQDNVTWGIGRVLLSAADSISTGQQKTFVFNITAPSTAGTYDFQWRMVQDNGGGWFGDFSSNVQIVVEHYDAMFVSQSVPTVVRPNEVHEVSLTFENTGSTIWRGSSGDKLESQNPRGNSTWGLSAVPMSTAQTIFPGQRKRFTFDIAVPPTPGLYNFQWQMVKGVTDVAFGEPSANVQILVEHNNSQFLSQSVPSVMQIGKSYSVTLSYKNTGTTTWTRNSLHKLGSQNPEDNLDWGLGRVLLGTGDSIAPGQQKGFTFNVTPPSTPGTYDFQWRMVQDGGGGWFGDFSPNVEVQVEHNDAVFVSQSVPSEMLAGETRQASVTYRNAGSRTWTRTKEHRLGSQNPQDNLAWGVSRVFLSSTDSIATGQEKTFTFNITAPSSPGSHNFQWRMVQDNGGGWFGDFSPNVEIVVEHNDAEFVSQSVPSEMLPGETKQVSLIFENTGTRVWRVPTNYRLGSQNPQDNLNWGISRVSMNPSQTILPGQRKSFSFSVTAPSTPGVYDFQWRMVQDDPSGGWFGDFSTNVSIQVNPNRSRVIAQEVPTEMEAGEAYLASITYENSGTSTWTQVGGYQLGSQNPVDNTNWGLSRVPLLASDSIVPGGRKMFSGFIRAPSTPGTYVFQWRMLQDGVGWFGELTPAVQVRVVANSALFVDQVVPTLMRPGETSQVSVTLSNNGSHPWTAAGQYRLGSQNPEDNLTWGRGRVDLGPADSIDPGEQKTFVFNITAPPTAGLYNFQWRMVEEGVGWFGDTTPNVSIEVSENDARFVSQTVPDFLFPGEVFRVSLIFENVGTRIWRTSADHRLGSQNPQDNLTWGLSRVSMKDSQTIIPGQRKAFRFNITAPTVPGVYNFRWRMVQDGLEWFGEASPNVQITVSEHNSRFMTQTVPATMAAGEPYFVSLTLENTGQSTWTRAGGFELGSRNPTDNSHWGFSRVPFFASEVIAPGDLKTIEGTIRAPSTPGTYNFQWQMLQVATGHFGDLSPNVVVEVKGPPQINSLSMSKIPPSATTTFEVTGTNLFPEDLYIPESSAEGFTAPILNAVQEIDRGTRLSVTVTTFSNERSWMIVSANDAGTDGIDFRVAGPGPVVDAFTPSEPLIGRLTQFVAVGANLKGASVVCTNPAVSITNLDNSNDEVIFGLLEVESTAGPGLDQILVTKGGVTKVLDVSLGNTLTEKHHETTPASPVYMQDLLIIACVTDDPSLFPPPSFPCEFRFFRPVFQADFAVVLTLHGIDGQLNGQIFDGMEEGETREFGVRLVAISISVTISAIIDTCGRFQATFCISGTGGIEILGLPGIVGQFTICFPGASVFGQGISAPQNPEIAVHTEEGCMTTPSPFSLGDGPGVEGEGIWISTVEAGCCPDRVTMLVDVETSLFVGTEIEVLDFGVSDRPFSFASGLVCPPNPVVVIDPGHGAGGTATAPQPTCTTGNPTSSVGATGPTGLIEHEVALSVAGLVAQELQLLGIDVFLTRGQNNIAHPDRWGVANNLNATVFVSIHFDDLAACPSPNRTRVNYHALNSNVESIALAQIMAPLLGVATGYNSAAQAGEFIVINGNCHNDPNRASVLVEGSFICDPVEEARLRTTAYQLELATAIAGGIRLFLGIP